MKNMMSTIAAGGVAAVLVILLIGVLLAVSFFATAGLVWLVCWAFSLAFSWKITFGIWIVICILRSIFSRTVTVNRN